MHTLRHHVGSGVIFALLAGLLLVPLVLRAHAHGGHHTSRSCGTCVVVHHTPTIIGSPAALPPPARVAATAAPTPPAITLGPRAVFATERGPPPYRVAVLA